jgi:DNA-binding MarR family transcriptional regulator
MEPQSTSAEPRKDEPAVLDLQAYFPYRLAILAEEVSRTVAQLYTDRFDLTRPEWRILAALGNRREVAAKTVGRASALDKMQVSRAVARLEKRGLIDRHEDPEDRRNQILRLTPAGRTLYRKIVPLALAREAYVLSALGAEELNALDRIMTKLLAQARGLESRG